MAYTLKLGSFAKHENSTAQPTTTGWAEYSVVLKNGADLRTPVLEIAADMTTISAFNYAVFLDRYYWVRSKNMARAGFCIITLEVDPMATHKAAIGAANLYILRSSTAFNGLIRDEYYPMTGEQVRSNTVLAHNPVSFSSGYYVVNVMGNQTGTSTLYRLSPSAFSSFVSSLINVIETSTPTISDYWDALKLGMFDPIKYITSVMWFPDPFPVEGTAKRIYVGLWDTGVDGYIINDPEYTITYSTVTLAKHPQQARGDYLNAAPYTHYFLEYDPFGMIELDATRLIEASSVRIKIFIDALTGAGILKVYSNDADGGCLASVEAQYGVPLPLGQNSINSGVISGSAATIGGAIAGAITGEVSLMAEAASAGIGTMASALKGIVSSIGSGGSIIGLAQNKTLHASFFKIVAEDNDRNGRPYCQVTTPATLTGYMVAQKGDIDIAAPLPELQAVEAFLTSGFYYE